MKWFQTFTVAAAAFTMIAAATDRFDHQVRTDFFSGFSGNREALQRGMNTAEAILKANPNHAEALVWHGAGLYFLAGSYFRSGDAEKGMEYAGRGQAEMDRAVALEPDNVGVRIPRGATLMAAARSMLERNPDFARPILQKGLSDYEHVYELQKAKLPELGEHPAGELLFGIADANSRIGNTERAAEFFDRIAETLPNTVYAKRASMWKQTKSLPIGETGCVGCHTASSARAGLE